MHYYSSYSFTPFQFVQWDNYVSTPVEINKNAIRILTPAVYSSYFLVIIFDHHILFCIFSDLFSIIYVIQQIGKASEPAIKSPAPGTPSQLDVESVHVHYHFHRICVCKNLGSSGRYLNQIDYHLSSSAVVRLPAECGMFASKGIQLFIFFLTPTLIISRHKQSSAVHVKYRSVILPVTPNTIKAKLTYYY